MQESDGSLRMGSGREDCTLVVAEDFQPRAEVARMVWPGLEFGRDAKIGADERG